MNRISPEGRLEDYHPDVGKIWRSRHQELEKQEFEHLPPWMNREPEDIETRIDLKKIFPKIFETLGPQEIVVLQFRFWCDMTLEDCGRALNVTKERIRQIEKLAIRKIKSPRRFAIMGGYLRHTYMMRIKEVEELEEKQDWFKY
jgi:RNA polymerase primary sigma factor